LDPLKLVCLSLKLIDPFNEADYEVLKDPRAPFWVVVSEDVRAEQPTDTLSILFEYLVAWVYFDLAPEPIVVNVIHV
jgi:hypothetical protein